jgi:hypothetical protein
MNSTGTFLAVYLGSKDGARKKKWDAMPEAEQQAKMQEGIAAWHTWVQKHQSSIVVMGGPLGKTKRVDPAGAKDIANQLGGFTVVRADSHEAAAKMFDNHPHFAIFPGDAVEIMPVMAIPGA